MPRTGKAEASATLSPCPSPTGHGAAANGVPGRAGTGRGHASGVGRRCGAKLVGTQPGQPGHPLAHDLQAHHARLDLADALGHRIEVVANVAVALGKLSLHRQAHQRAEHRPAFAHRLQEDEVIQTRCEHQQRQQRQEADSQESPAVQVQHARAPGAAAGDHQLHR
jgi:hypothetical protein